MKKSALKLVSLLLAVSMVFCGFSSVGASAANDIGDSLTHVGVSALEFIVKSLLTGICNIVPAGSGIKKVSEHVSDNFYKGMDKFLEEPADNAEWSLGYAKASLVPDDILEKGTEYYLGGFMTIDNGTNNKVEEVIDDMQIRSIAIADGSGRGVTVYANVDCIGFCNSDILTVRKYLKELNPKADLNAVNITSTHCHSCIDTQGLWTNTFKKVLSNIVRSYIPGLKHERGVNTEWLDWACRVMAKAINESINDMTEGTMTYAVKTLNPEYFNNKNRKSSTSLNSDMSRFVFTPYDTTKTPTMMVNINAHPDVVGLATSDPEDNGRQLSGDYVYYMGKTIEEGGYNFMFINGAIAGIYYGRGLTNDGVDFDRRYINAVRYGTEMGKIALNLTSTYDEISAKENWNIINKESKDNENYTLWFEGWKPVTERELEPLFNIKLKEVMIQVKNPLMKLVGKIELTSYTLYKDGFNYYMISEIGIAQFGDVTVAMMPGEVVQDLVYGGASLTAEGSFKGKDYGYPTIREILGKDAIVFGLCNDACGYIVPDNDYSLGIVDDHYQELISLGDVTASTVTKAFVELANEIGIK